MKRLIFQKWDEKARMWAAHLRPWNVHAVGVESSPIRAPLFLLKEIVTGRRPCAYVFRYLNDYRSLAKTLLRVLSEMIVIVIAKSSGTRILWILHNVDRESSEFWPRITAFRRNVIARFSSASFVIDPLLVDDAEQHFPGLEWEAAPFGAEAVRTASPQGTRRIVDELAKLRADLTAARRGPVFIGLCVTAMSPKCAHLFRFGELVAENGKGNWATGILFVGAFSKAGERWKRVLQEIERAEHVRALDIELWVDEVALAPHFDFIYRSVADLSVPYSFYRAAAAGKPIITHDDGLGARIVSRCGVGLIATLDAPGDWPAFFKEWTRHRWDAFLAERSWAIGAQRLAAALADCGSTPGGEARKRLSGH